MQTDGIRRGRLRLRWWFAGALALLFAWGSLKLPEILAFRDGLQAYLYGYPLVMMDLTREVMTAPGPWLAPEAKHRMGAGPVNHFSHTRTYPDDAFRDVVVPNADTLYSLAWLDLSAGPLVLSLPDTQGRFVLMELMDGWSNAVAAGGTRLYGGLARQYLITGPGWAGSVPPGMVRLSSDTQLSWLIGRTLTSGPADFAAVHRLQDQYQLVPLAQWGQPQAETPPNLEADPDIDMATPPVTRLAHLDARGFFNRLATLMAINPPATDDTPMVATLARYGIVPGQPFKWAALSPAQQAGLEDALWFARALFDTFLPGSQGETGLNSVERRLFQWLHDSVSKSALNMHDGWAVPLNLGRYGTNYELRAIVAMMALGANVPDDAVYPLGEIDVDGELLDGGRRYSLHFAPDRLPPARAFWSVTMYSRDGFFIANPIDRYAIGDRNPLQYNADGSLDLWIQHDAPTATRQPNWLPAPSGPFKLVMRLYTPSPDLLRGSWTPPPVRRQAP